MWNADPFYLQCLPYSILEISGLVAMKEIHSSFLLAKKIDMKNITPSQTNSPLITFI